MSSTKSYTPSKCSGRLVRECTHSSILVIEGVWLVRECTHGSILVIEGVSTPQAITVHMNISYELPEHVHVHEPCASHHNYSTTGNFWHVKIFILKLIADNFGIYNFKHNQQLVKFNSLPCSHAAIMLYGTSLYNNELSTGKSFSELNFGTSVASQNDWKSLSNFWLQVQVYCIVH